MLMKIFIPFRYIILAGILANIQGRPRLRDIFSSIANACKLNNGITNVRKATLAYKNKHPREQLTFPHVIFGTPDRFNDYIGKIFDVIKETDESQTYVFNLNGLRDGPRVNPQQQWFAKISGMPLPCAPDYEFEPLRGKKAIDKVLKLYAVLQHYYAYEFLDLDNIKIKNDQQIAEMSKLACDFLEVQKTIKELKKLKAL